MIPTSWKEKWTDTEIVIRTPRATRNITLYETITHASVGVSFGRDSQDFHRVKIYPGAAPEEETNGVKVGELHFSGALTLRCDCGALVRFEPYWELKIPYGTLTVYRTGEREYDFYHTVISLYGKWTIGDPNHPKGMPINMEAEIK